MRRIFFTGLILFCGFTAILSQNHQVTFTNLADSISVDSVYATNIYNCQSIMLPGDEALILEQSSGINQIHNGSVNLMVYPNPFNDITSLNYSQIDPGEVTVTLHNHIGQLLYQTIEFLETGEHTYTLSLNKAGIYFITISGTQCDFSVKAICTQTSNSFTGITYNGNYINQSFKAVVQAQSQPQEYRLAYSPNQVMHFICYGGKHTTIFTDTVEASIDYDVEFVDCTDPDGRTYNVVKIGDQFWMEENLAYLPEVRGTEDFTYYEPTYMVYAFEDNNLQNATKSENYLSYGALYNLPAAQASCPDGWRLPFDDEWIKLELAIGLENSETYEFGFRSSGRIGAKMKTKNFSTHADHWWVMYSNNYSGFNALPGGYWFHSNFTSKNKTAIFWVAPGEFFQDGFYSLPVRELADWNRGIKRYEQFPGGGLSIRCIKSYPVQAAEVATNPAQNITGTSAKGGGTIIFRGGEILDEKGICWSSQPEPSIDNSIVISTEPGLIYNCELTDLEPNSQYYIRAFVTNTKGTYYGEQFSFITTDGSFE